jgi:hypothetical protein
MGKAKKTRASRNARHNPLGSPSSPSSPSPSAAAASGGGGGGAAAPAAAAGTNKAHTLLQELRSSDISRKEAAVVAIAQVLEAGDVCDNNGGGTEEEVDTHTETHTQGSSSSKKKANGLQALIQKLLAGGAVPLLIERMFDTSSEVNLHAAGALR